MNTRVMAFGCSVSKSILLGMSIGLALTVNGFGQTTSCAASSERGAALLVFLISMKFRASSLVRGRLRLSFFLDDFQSAATTGLG